MRKSIAIALLALSAEAAVAQGTFCYHGTSGMSGAPVPTIYSLNVWHPGEALLDFRLQAFNTCGLTYYRCPAGAIYDPPDVVRGNGPQPVTYAFYNWYYTDYWSATMTMTSGVWFTWFHSWISYPGFVTSCPVSGYVPRISGA